MISLKSIFHLALTVSLFVFGPNSAAAQEIPLPMSVCTEEFVADFDLAAEAFAAVGLAIESKSGEHQFRAAVVSALNACHSFVEKYVTIDPVSSKWVGESCSRIIPGSDENQPNKTVLVEPRAHKAECDYLQRLLDRADVAL